MKNTFIAFATLAGAAMLFPSGAGAQFAQPVPEKNDTNLCKTLADCTDDVKQPRMMFVKTTEEDRQNLKKMLQPVPNAVPVPNFVIKSAGGSFYMAVGGQINTVVGCDLGNELYQVAGAGGGFTTADIPLHPAKGHKADFFINPLNANLTFQAVGLAGTPNEISGYIKIGTPGNVTGLNLKDAYLSWRGFTAGQKSTLFEDGEACQPPTIDSEGPCGEVSATVYGIDYKSPSWSGFQCAIGVEMPTFCNSNGIYRGKEYQSWDGKRVEMAVNQNFPDIPLWLQYTFSENNRIRLSGMFRSFRYHDMVTDVLRSTLGYGVMLSGNFSPVKPLIFYLQAAYGKGIGTYIQDLSGLPLGYVPDDDNLGRASATPMMGMNFGLTYNITSKWQLNAMGSTTRLWKVGDYAKVLPDSQNYKYAIYAAGNLFYNISNYLQVGVEYLWGQRMTWGAGSATDQRIQAQVQLTL